MTDIFHLLKNGRNTNIHAQTTEKGRFVAAGQMAVISGCYIGFYNMTIDLFFVLI